MEDAKWCATVESEVPSNMDCKALKHWEGRGRNVLVSKAFTSARDFAASSWLSHPVIGFKVGRIAQKEPGNTAENSGSAQPPYISTIRGHGKRVVTAHHSKWEDKHKVKGILQAVMISCECGIKLRPSKEDPCRMPSCPSQPKPGKGGGT